MLIRQRPGINKSWALVTLSDRAACERAISGTAMAGDNALVVKSVSMEQAMQVQDRLVRFGVSLSERVKNSLTAQGAREMK